jgi:phosphate acyltransferase
MNTSAPGTDHAHEKSAGMPRDIVISIDAMGGDRGVADVVRGMGKSLEKNPRLRFIVHGDGQALEDAIRRHSPLASRTEIRDAPNVIGMDAKPSRALRSAEGSSMWNALASVRDGESPAVISCGNTGALMALSMLALRKAPGVDRPAIAVLWPSKNPSAYNVVLDAGADIRADAKDLVKYALMGASYARNALGLKTPRVGLLNVGIEEHKGRPEIHQAAEMIAAASTTGDFEYIGYVEGNDMPSDRVDVIVTDGFAGNIALKAAEGTAQMIGSLLRDAFNYSPLSRLGGVFALTSLRRFQKRIDPRHVNGGVFLGLNGTVIKSHGSADATGISAAIKLAFTLSESGFNRRLAARVAGSAALGSIDLSKEALPGGALP